MLHDIYIYIIYVYMYNCICLDGNHIQQLIARYWVAIYCLAGELWGHWVTHCRDTSADQILPLRTSIYRGFPANHGWHRRVPHIRVSHMILFCEDHSWFRHIWDYSTKISCGQQSAHSLVVLLRFFFASFLYTWIFQWAHMSTNLWLFGVSYIFSLKWAPMTNVDHEQKFA